MSFYFEFCAAGGVRKIAQSIFGDSLGCLISVGMVGTEKSVIRGSEVAGEEQAVTSPPAARLPVRRVFMVVAALVLLLVTPAGTGLLASFLSSSRTG